MHIGYQLSNILESVATHKNESRDALYLCHNSLFDLFLASCDINLNNYDTNNKKFLENNNLISTWSTNDLIKSYPVHIVNNPLTYLKNNNSIHFHLNSIIFAHDTNLLTLKKEDSFLLCTNGFKQNDTMVYFSSILSKYNCPKITSIKLDYSIPDSLTNLNTPKDGLGIFCYNKSVGLDLINSVDPTATILTSLPNSTEEINNILNKYERFVELDPASIINVLAAIACGCVGIILDPNNTLLDYKNISNLYIVNSLPELKELVDAKPKYKSETVLFDSRFRNFDSFKQTIIEIIKAAQRKAFIL